MLSGCIGRQEAQRHINMQPGLRLHLHSVQRRNVLCGVGAGVHVTAICWN